MKALSLGTFVIAALALSALLDADSGLSIWLDLRRELETSDARVERLVRENDALRGEIAILEREPEALDRAIREELDLVLPGEVVVRFEPVRSGSAEAVASADGRAGSDGRPGRSPGEGRLGGESKPWSPEPGSATAGSAGALVEPRSSAEGEEIERPTSDLESWADDAPTIVDDAPEDAPDGGESF